ncbi:MAG: nucleotide exchange factor GrpE [Bdellovibrionota bacterium]
MSEDNNDAKTDSQNDGAETPSVEALQEELDKTKKDYLYLRADFDNFKKAAIRERSELVKYGAERVVTELLDILDNFDRALSLDLTSENMGSFKEGLTLTRNEFHKMLSRFGVTPVESEGQPFDPNLHEALSSEETDSMPQGHITQVFKKAYKLHDKLIRPAQVVVAKEMSKKE